MPSAPGRHSPTAIRDFTKIGYKVKKLLTEWRQFIKEDKEAHIKGINDKIDRLRNEIERATQALEDMDESAKDPHSEEMTAMNLMDIRSTPQYFETQTRISDMNDKISLLLKQAAQLKQDTPGDLPRGNE